MNFLRTLFDPQGLTAHLWNMLYTLPGILLGLTLHELAHAMTSTAEGESAGHGPAFVGLYLRLLVRHARMPEAELIASLRAAGIGFDPAARPVFLTG